MTKITTIAYRLPDTVLVINGIVRQQHDSVLDPPAELSAVPATLVSYTIDVQHVADDTDRTVDVPGGWFFSYKGSFIFREDHRLTTATVESTGEVGTVLKAVATIAGAVAGLRPRTIVEEEARRRAPSPEERLDKAYKSAYPNEAQRRKDLMTQRRSAQEKIAAATKVLIEGDGQDDAIRQRLRRLTEAEASLDRQLAPLEAHLTAWRASTIKAVDTSFELRVPIKDVPTQLPPQGWEPPASVKASGVPGSLADLWNRYGFGVQATWGVGRNANPVPVNSKVTEIATRRPYPARFDVVEHREGIRVVTKVSRHLVVDTYSPVETFQLKRSWFGRRSLNLAFSQDGFLTGVGSEGAAAIASLAGTAAQLPADVAAGVESATKLRTSLATAQRAGLEAELSRVKQEVELRQQKLLADGLDATGKDTVRVERLKQLAAIIEAQTTILGADPSLIEPLSRIAGEELAWYQPPAPTPPEDKTITVVVRPGPPADIPPNEK